MSEHTLEPVHDMDAHEPHNPVRTYIFTLLTLLVLTIITVGVAQFDFGEGNVIVALGIASVKATVVCLFFMHLLHDKPLNSIILGTALIMLSILLMFSFMDKGTRVNLITQGGQAPAGSSYERPAKLGVPYLGEKKAPAPNKPIETPR
jgi:cytochrome c oxidase subunit IV